MTTNQVLSSTARQRVIPGGVNSPVRAFRSVGGTPRFFERAQGAYLWDVDGKRYIDYVGSWGPMILGHSHPAVVGAVQERAALGLSFGAPTALEVELAELLCSLLPSMEMVRLVSSGTEATMSAIRLARGYTGRDNIIKFEGCYHGHADSLLVKAGSGALTFGVATSAGVPADFVGAHHRARFNDLDQVEAAFERQSGPDRRHHRRAGRRQHEPASRRRRASSKACASCATQHGAVLIFDEVMTGFRVASAAAPGR